MFGWNALFTASIFKGRSLTGLVMFIFLGFGVLAGGLWLNSIVTSRKTVTEQCKATPQELQYALNDYFYDGTTPKTTVPCEGTKTVYGFPFKAKAIFVPSDTSHDKTETRYGISEDLSWNLFATLSIGLVLSYIIWKKSEE